MEGSEQSLKAAFEKHGQAHIFRFWEELDDNDRASLLKDAGEIDLVEIDDLVGTLVKGEGESKVDFSELEPAPYVIHPSNGGDCSEWQNAHAIGEELLKGGKVAAFTVAGGQGTRLGYDGPKGTFPVTPVNAKTLFQVFAEKLLETGQLYGSEVPWFIMTSPQNHAATVEAFEQNSYFGLKQNNVHFFPQGRIAAVDSEGKILLSSKSSIAMTPDGHGGSLRALVRSGAVEVMEKQEISYISYFQVDNPLVQCIDPAFIGFHAQSGSEMSSKMIPKAYAGEKVGHFCSMGDKMMVIEYSDLPSSMQEETDSNGKLRFLAGSIAIHILSVDFVSRVGAGTGNVKLPFHRANKKIATIDADGKPFKPETPNGIKFEMFVFDALPFARSPIVIETLREDDFSPVKNAEGLDSPETCKADQLRQWTRWLIAAGVEMPTDESGLPESVFEISPLFASTQDRFVSKWNSLSEKPEIGQGTVLD